MITRWTAHLKDPQDIEDFNNKLLGSRAVLDRLLMILLEEEAALERSEEDQRIYDQPNWDYRQAHKNGIRQNNKSIQRLINLDHQKGTT